MHVLDHRTVSAAAISAALTAVTTLVGGATLYPPEYPAVVTEVVDGDTIGVEVYVWPEVVVRTRVRVSGVDTPELRAKSQCERLMARRAKDLTTGFVDKDSKMVTLHIRGKDKYGRVLATVSNSLGVLSEFLTTTIYGRSYDGGSRDESWCVD